MRYVISGSFSSYCWPHIFKFCLASGYSNTNIRTNVLTVTVRSAVTVTIFLNIYYLYRCLCCKRFVMWAVNSSIFNFSNAWFTYWIVNKSFFLWTKF